MLSGVPWAMMFAIPMMDLESLANSMSILSLETGPDVGLLDSNLFGLFDSLDSTGLSVLLAGFLYGLSQVMWIVGLWCVGRQGMSQLKSRILSQSLIQSFLLRLRIRRKGHQPNQTN